MRRIFFLLLSGTGTSCARYEAKDGSQFWLIPRTQLDGYLTLIPTVYFVRFSLQRSSLFAFRYSVTSELAMCVNYEHFSRPPSVDGKQLRLPFDSYSEEEQLHATTLLLLLLQLEHNHPSHQTRRRSFSPSARHCSSLARGAMCGGAKVVFRAFLSASR